MNQWKLQIHCKEFIFLNPEQEEHFLITKRTKKKPKAINTFCEL